MRRLSAAQWLLVAGVALIAVQMLVWGQTAWDLLFPFPGLCLCVAAAALAAQRRPAVAVWTLIGLALVPVVVIAVMAVVLLPSASADESVEPLIMTLVGIGLVVQSAMLAAVFGLAYFLARRRSRQQEGSAVGPAAG